MASIQGTIPITEQEQFISPYRKIQILLEETLDKMGLTLDDLNHLPEVSPYLILDGHRTGISDHEENPTRGYIEGAIFSLRFAKIFQVIGGKRATFLIHTLRNYQTMDRMAAIFEAIENVSKKFIRKAVESDIRLKYFGEGVHDVYAMSKIINAAEDATKECSSFDLNFLTNYSEDWASCHQEELEELSEITVIGRFTKGHHSGAGIPGHANRANFMYIQQASVSENWSDQEIVLLILSLLKSHLSLKGYVGGKSYKREERDKIWKQREFSLFEENIRLSEEPTKRVISFSPMGPIFVYF